jgi:curved DNA-binding protein CbpA
MTHQTGLNVTDKKQTLYEILGVSPSASIAEIKVAHRLLTRSLLSEKLGLRREEIDLKLQVLDLAWNTLSNQADRDAYDAQLAARTPPANIALRADSNLVPQRAVPGPLMIAAAIEAIHDKSVSSESGRLTPLAVMATTVDRSVSSLWKILKVIAGLLVLGVVISAASAILAGRQARQPGGAISKAEEKVIIQEYYQQHGVRPGSKEEVHLLEIERLRKVNEERAATVGKEREDREYKRFVEESRRQAEQVSSDLQRAEEQARQKAEREKQQAEERQRQKEEAEQEAERRRLEAARQRMGPKSDPQSPDE